MDRKIIKFSGHNCNDRIIESGIVNSGSDSYYEDEIQPDEGRHLHCLVHCTYHTPRVIDTTQNQFISYN